MNHRIRHPWRLGAWLLTCVGLFFAMHAQAGALRGSVPIVFLLCEPNDGHLYAPPMGPPAPLPRPSVQALKQRLIERGGGGVADLVHDWSQGLVDFDAARFFGWHTLPMTREQWQAGGRAAIIQRCLDHVSRNDPAWRADPPVNPIAVVVGYPRIDLGASDGRAVLPENVITAEAMHEIGHGMGLRHAHAELVRGGRISMMAEYGDPWTVMAAMTAIFSVNTAYGAGPAGFVAPELQALGWLPTTRMVTHGADGAQRAQYCLAPLNQPELPGWLAVRVQLSETDPLEGLVVEYRNLHGWGRGVPPGVGPRVLVHKVARAADGLQRVSLLYDRTDFSNGWLPAQAVELAGGVRVRVVGTDSGGCGARIEVDQGAPLTPAQQAWRQGTLGPLACRIVAGVQLVPRQLDPYDHVCTTPAARVDHLVEGSAWRRGQARLGANFCPAGQVFREAFKHDFACVTPASRDRAQADNAAASRNWVLP